MAVPEGIKDPTGGTAAVTHPRMTEPAMEAEWSCTWLQEKTQSPSPLPEKEPSKNLLLLAPLPMVCPEGEDQGARGSAGGVKKGQ